jgi:hypothetical protein
MPTGTALLQQPEMFQDSRRRIGLVVDAFGEVQSLLTLEDIVGGIVGEFTAQAPGSSTTALTLDADGQVIVDGSVVLRGVNRWLQLRLRLDRPRNLSGLLLERRRRSPTRLAASAARTAPSIRSDRRAGGARRPRAARRRPRPRDGLSRFASCRSRSSALQIRAAWALFSRSVGPHCRWSTGTGCSDPRVAGLSFTLAGSSCPLSVRTLSLPPAR